MNLLIDILPWLIAMVILMSCSAFFSGSEAALFYLCWEDRRALVDGSRSQRMAAALLQDPDRLLSAVLLWNLAVNMTYFAIASIVGMRLEQLGSGTPAVIFSVGSVLSIILLSEMLPKSLAVLSARRVAGLIGLPLTLAVRALDPVMPALRVVSLLSRRLVWPGFQRESYLDIRDLERAIELSTEDASLVAQEQATLRNIVMLSDIRAHEWMWPRTQFLTFRPPVSLCDLGGQMTPSGYLLVTDQAGEEVAGAINLNECVDVPDEHLERKAEPVIMVPWCATVADVLQRMQQDRRDVAAVVNELGETIGILTFHDILDTVFHEDPSRGTRMLDREPIQDVGGGRWHVNGMTNLRRLERKFGVRLPQVRGATVGGVIQDVLQRLAMPADEVDWGPFHFRVLEVSRRGQLLVELTRRDREGRDA